MHNVQCTLQWKITLIKTFHAAPYHKWCLPQILFKFLDTQVSLAPTHVSPYVRTIGPWYFWISIPVYFPKVYFPKIYFPKVSFPKCIPPRCIFPKCIYCKCIFAKCTRLTCLLSFLSFSLDRVAKCTQLACLLSFASLFLNLLNKLRKLRRHASRVHLAKIHLQ